MIFQYSENYLELSSHNQRQFNIVSLLLVGGDITLYKENCQCNQNPTNKALLSTESDINECNLGEEASL